MSRSLTALAWLVLIFLAVGASVDSFSGVDPGGEEDLRRLNLEARVALYKMNTTAIENLSRLPGYRLVVYPNQNFGGTTAFAIPEAGDLAYRCSIEGYHVARLRTDDDRTKPETFLWVPLR